MNGPGGSARFGEPHHHHALTDSTNLRARELAEAGAPSGTVVTADEQSAGRGRAGRTWSSPAGQALLYSAILRRFERPHSLLSLTVALAVAEACESLAPVECELKWPNDVWIEERKVAGILIEARAPEWAVIGVGINLSIAPEDFPKDLRWPATSLGHGTNPEGTRVTLDEALGRWVGADPARVRAEYAGRDVLRGRKLSWEDGPERPSRSGVGEGIDENGHLLVRDEDGEVCALGSGEVDLRVG